MKQELAFTCSGSFEQATLFDAGCWYLVFLEDVLLPRVNEFTHRFANSRSPLRRRNGTIVIVAGRAIVVLVVFSLALCKPIDDLFSWIGIIQYWLGNVWKMMPPIHKRNRNRQYVPKEFQRRPFDRGKRWSQPPCHVRDGVTCLMPGIINLNPSNTALIPKDNACYPRWYGSSSVPTCYEDCW